MTFGQQVKDTRLALGLTQSDLAQALGTTLQSVSNWECERTTPWPKQQVEILSTLLRLSGDRPAAEVKPATTSEVKPALTPHQRIIDRI